MDPFSVVGRAVFDIGRDLAQRRRRVRLRTHGAFFQGSDELCIIEPWETWVRISELGAQLTEVDLETVLRSARVRLSTGRTLKTKPSRDVPAVGSVPGSESVPRE